MGRFVRGFFVGMVLLAAVGVGVAWRQGWLGRSGEQQSGSGERQAGRGETTPSPRSPLPAALEEERARELRKSLSADRAAAGALSEWARWWAMGEAAEKRDDPEAADAHYAQAQAALEGLSSDLSDLSDDRQAECDAALAKCGARMAAKRAEADHAIATLTGHEGTVCSVAFSPDGGTLASGSCDDAIKLWGIRLLRGKPR